MLTKVVAYGRKSEGIYTIAETDEIQSLVDFHARVHPGMEIVRKDGADGSWSVEASNGDGFRFEPLDSLDKELAALDELLSKIANS